MKNKIKKSIVAITLASSLTVNVYAAVQWAGSQDVQEAKDNITTIRGLFNAKNERIRSLEQELDSKASENNAQLKQAERDVKDINKLLDDVVKENGE